MKILFLVPYPLKESPSQRFRFEQYLDTLTSAGHSFRIQSFLQSSSWRIVFEGGHVFMKLWIIAKGFIRRAWMLVFAATYDFVFIHREAAPIGPPLFEWIISKVLRRKIIYDFDDAIWLTDKIGEGPIARAIRWRTKVKSICRWSYRVSCGNDYLCAFARQFNANVVYNPSTIDTERIQIAEKNYTNNDRIVIGWTGSHSTMKFIDDLVPVLQQLECENPNIEFLVISDRPPVLPLKSVRFMKWSAYREIDDLNQIDVGVMPLPDTEWSKGKCGFKALQYMSLMKPALVSAVGANRTIVEHGVTGFHCTTKEDWLSSIRLLVADTAKRRTMGKKGAEKVLKSYSVTSNAANFLALFE